MKKTKTWGRFPVEAVTEAVANSELAKKLKAKVKHRLTRTAPKRLRRWCIVLMTTLFVCDLLLLFRASWHRWMAPHYSIIQPAVTVGEIERRPVVKGFATEWDSLMGDPALKKGWDSLLHMRPGLRDTVRALQKMDSAVLGK